MSKEAVGENGAILGVSAYWSQVNRSTFLGELMGNSSETDYFETLQGLSVRAGAAVEEIYGDLQDHIRQIRFLPTDRRSALAKQVRGLYDIGKMTGSPAGYSDACISILDGLDSSALSQSAQDGEAVQTAVQKISSASFSSQESVDLIRSAVNWSLSFAAGNSESKLNFLEDVSQGKDRDFLQAVLDTYESSSGSADLNGQCGYEIGSSAYLNSMEQSVFQTGVPLQYCASWGSMDYASALRDSLEAIAGALERDLGRNERENNYITDETAETLNSAVSELDRCGAGTGSLSRQILKLAWFVGGNPAQIRQLQSKLNELGMGGHLEVDGVYGEKTLAAWEKYLNDLEHGTVPTLAWIDPLQSNLTGITIDSAKYGTLYGINDALMIGSHPYIRIDPAPNGTETAWIQGVKKDINYPHLNFDKIPNSNWLYDQIQSRYNHYPLSDKAYDALKDFKSTGKVVRIAGKILLVAGIALDALELGTTIDADLKDADRKLGKKTLSTAASIGGRWAGAAAGAELGALIGVCTGPAAPIAIPVLSLAGGIGGAFGGDWLGKYIVDITDVED